MIAHAVRERLSAPVAAGLLLTVNVDSIDAGDMLAMNQAYQLNLILKQAAAPQGSPICGCLVAIGMLLFFMLMGIIAAIAGK